MVESKAIAIANKERSIVENGGKNYLNKKLPTLKKGSSLKGTVSKNNVLERMTSDAFNIVSSLSSSETVIGAWVVDKEAATQLQNICNEWANFTGLSSYEDVNKLAAMFTELYHLRNNPEEEFLEHIQELFIRRILLPSKRGYLKRIGFDRDAFANKINSLKIKPLTYLKLDAVDTNLRTLIGMTDFAKADFSKFKNLEG